ncbi:hypothetical protein C1X05_04665 [Laceyella sacchari]|jgi:hypothetical protein|uniref:Uncharacterized protein n=1 Tax=Laceyella tengchongensis TaxID=574699 RepID=A0AA45WJN4_9BACL|nr:hypothetical protein [Laceyella tengchongensis]AUS08191.1 hypothetical protein C1X05_04665 [Laceyella sacchari]SMP03631.1 hypothetical protein SAMN06265361_101465 [Laceyella tengchongensis]
MTGLVRIQAVIAFWDRDGVGKKKKVDLCPCCHAPGGQVEKVGEKWLCYICETVMSETELGI